MQEEIMEALSVLLADELRRQELSDSPSDFLLDLQAGGESLSEKVHDHLVRASGYASLEEAEKKLKARG